MATNATSTARREHGSHPLLAAVAAMEAALDEATSAWAAGVDPSWLSTTDQARLLTGLARAEARVAAMKLATLTALDGPDGIAAATGARSAGDWLAHRLHLSARRTGAEARLGARVSDRPVLRAAMLQGEATPDHARAVVEVLDTLPADLVDAQTMAAAEATLTGYCAEFTPAEVTHLGRRILETVAPETAEEIEAEKLARAEREAWRRTKLTTRTIGEGLTRVTADLPALHASILDTVLDAIGNPTHPDNQPDSRPDSRPDSPEQTADDGQRISGAQRRGQAFCTLLETLDTTRLPHRHGTAVEVTVVVEEDKLRRDLHASGLLTTTGGVEITLGQGRRLLCNAGIWPTVMGGDSVVLDAGRTRRFIGGKMRKALEVAHPTCQTTGCTVPAAWCDGHHLTPWAEGGTTRIDDTALLCPHHHRRVHDAHYETKWAHGQATFHPRT